MSGLHSPAASVEQLSQPATPKQAVSSGKVAEGTGGSLPASPDGAEHTAKPAAAVEEDGHNSLMSPSPSRLSGSTKDPLKANLAELQQKTISLKVELQSCEEEVRRYRRLYSLLDGDLQTKMEWLQQWQKQLTTTEATTSKSSSSTTPNWSLRRKFVERGAQELRKTQRLLGRPQLEGAALDLLHSTHAELQSKLDDMSQVVVDLEEQVTVKETENAALKVTVRRKMRDETRRRGARAELERLRTQLSMLEQEESLLKAAAPDRPKQIRLLEAELTKAIRTRDDSSVYKRKQEITKATAVKEAVAQQLMQTLRDDQQREEQTHKEHLQEQEQLQDECLRLTNETEQDQTESSSLRAQLETTEAAEEEHAAEEERKRQRVKEAAREAKAEAMEFKRRRDAATRIQKVVRGIRGRKKAARARLRKSSAVCVQRHVRGMIGRRIAAEARHERCVKAATNIQRTRRGQLGRRVAAQRHHERREAAATQVQRFGRGLLGRRKADRRRRAVRELQSYFRSWHAKQEVLQHAAAVCIQRKQRQVALSRRRQREAPAVLLRGDSFQTASHISDCESSVCGPHIVAVSAHEAEDGLIPHMEFQHGGAAKAKRPASPARVQRKTKESDDAGQEEPNASQAIAAMLDVNALLGQRPASDTDTSNDVGGSTHVDGNADQEQLDPAPSPQPSEHPSEQQPPPPPPPPQQQQQQQPPTPPLEQQNQPEQQSAQPQLPQPQLQRPASAQSMNAGYGDFRGMCQTNAAPSVSSTCPAQRGAGIPLGQSHSQCQSRRVHSTVSTQPAFSGGSQVLHDAPAAWGLTWFASLFGDFFREEAPTTATSSSRSSSASHGGLASPIAEEPPTSDSDRRISHSRICSRHCSTRACGNSLDWLFSARPPP